MAARITRVKLKDFRSIGACDVELQPLTLLVGPNGAGKSNFLDALRFLAHSMSEPLGQVVEARSGLKGVLRKLPQGQLARSFSIRVDFAFDDGQVGDYAIAIADGPDGAARIQEESCNLPGASFSVRDGQVISAIPPGFLTTVSDRPLLAGMSAHGDFAPVYNLICSMVFYAPQPEGMRTPRSAVAARFLAPDASNAAQVLARLERERPDIVARIGGYLHSFNPEFQDVTVTEANDYRWLSFTPSGNPSRWKIDSSEASDGTLRAVGILLAIFQRGSASGPISLVGLEEPENNLHPAAAGVLLDALIEASSNVPVIASTHSADMLDRKGLPANSILAVSMEDGETTIGSIDEAGAAILQKRLYTAGDLLRNNQLMPSKPLGAER